MENRIILASLAASLVRDDNVHKQVTVNPTRHDIDH
jgi:hypothetical protein